MTTSRAAHAAAACILLLAAAPGGLGCTYVIGGVVVALSAGGGGGGGAASVTNAPPVVTVAQPTRDVDGSLGLAVTITDGNEDLVDLAVAFSTDGGQSFTAATAAAGQANGQDLASAANGRLHDPAFVWDYQTDLGGLQASSVVLRVTPSDPSAPGTSFTTGSFIVGNDVPQITFVALDGSGGNVVVRYGIQDSTGDLCSVSATYRVDGGAPIAIPDANIVGGVTRSLLTDPQGGAVTFDFTWSTFDEPALTEGTFSVEVTLVPNDGFAAGAGVASPTGQVQNGNTPPVVQIQSVGTATGIAAIDGRIPITFALFDNEANLSQSPTSTSRFPAVDVLFSVDGQTFLPATGVSLRADGRSLGVTSTAALRAQPLPDEVPEGPDSNVHTFIWDALADGVAGVGTINAIVRLVPRSGTSVGQSDESPIALGEAAPLLSPDKIVGFQSGLQRTAHLRDLDGDAGVELVVAAGVGANPSPGAIEVLLGRIGNDFGVFAQHPLFDAGDFTTALALEDLDGDGLLDAIAANLVSSDLTVHLGDPFAIFGPPTSTPAGVHPFAVDAADLDLDGAPDVVSVDADALAAPGAPDVRAFLGDGAGGISQASSFDAGDFPVDVVLGDLDGDDLPDVVTANQESDDLAIGIGAGDGSFTAALGGAPPDTLAGGDAPRALALADLDRNGALDLLAANQSSADISVRLGNGAGGFGPEIGFGGSPRVPTGISPSDIVLADLNGDRFPDVAVSNRASNDLSVRLGLGDGRFGAEARLQIERTAPETLAIGDADADGALDIVTVNEFTGDMRLFRGTGGGGFGREPSIPAGVFPGGAGIADLDGDGILDVAALADGPVLVSLLLRGDGTVRQTTSTAVVLDADDFALGDIDGDGRLDLVVSHQTSDGITVRLGTGDGGFGPPIGPPALGVDFPGFRTAPGPTRIAVGDLDGDAELDIVAVGRVTDELTVLIQEAGGFVTSTLPMPTSGFPPGPFALDLGDLDLDGDLDIAVVGDGNRELALLLNDGSGAFTPSGVLHAHLDAPLDVRVRDLDGDGLLDVLVLDQGFGVIVRRGTGGGLLGGSVVELPLIATTGDTLTIGDVDGDGRLDVIVTENVSSIVHAFLQRAPRTIEVGREGGGLIAGDGRSAPLHFIRRSVQVPGSPRSVATADLTGDGVDDIAAIGATGLQLLVSAATGASRADADLTAAAARPVRRLPVETFELGAADGPGPSVRLAAVTAAFALTPEDPGVSVPTTTIAIPLSSELTRDELVNGTYRVLREDQGLRAANPADDIDRRFGRPRYARLTEVAGTTPGPGQGQAVVDPTTRTIEVPVDRLSRYQVFLEPMTTEQVIFRETFDAAGLDSLGGASRPYLWEGHLAWRVGVPRPADLAGGVRPAPASAPSLLALGLRRDYPRSSDPLTTSTLAVSTSLFPVPTDLAGRTVTLRMREWHDLAAGDVAEVILDVFENNGAGEAHFVVGTITGTSTGDVALVTSPDARVLSIDLTADLATGIAQVQDPANVRDPVGRITLAVTHDPNQATPARGWFIDDVEVVIDGP